MSEIQDYFVSEFKNRTADAIGREILALDNPLYVIPFYNLPKDLGGDFWGGLWLPSADQQENISHLDHWRLSQELAGAAAKRHLTLQGLLMRANLQIDEQDHLSVHAHDFALPYFGGIREGIEEQYNVQLVEYSAKK